MALELHNLCLSIKGETHLDDVSLHLESGRLYTIIGRTLSGKTTLLRAIAGLQQLDAGTLQLDGMPFDRTPVWKRGVAMVYQQFINYPHLTLLRNVAFPLRRAGVLKKEAERRAAEALDMVGLADFVGRRPSALSGGQQQRVALARALVKNAPLLLLDEPLVNLDYKLREALREEFLNILTHQKESIVIYTTTDPGEAMLLGHEVIVMHEGRVLQVGTPEQVFNAPVDIAAAQAVNDPPMNIFKADRRGHTLQLQGGIEIDVPVHLTNLSDGPCFLGSRAAQLTTSHSASAGGIMGEVQLTEISGSETFIHATTPFGHMVVQEEGIHAYATGEPVRLEIHPAALFAFNEDGRLSASPQASGAGEN